MFYRGERRNEGFSDRCPRNEDAKFVTAVGFQLNSTESDLISLRVASPPYPRLFDLAFLLSDALCNAACLFILRTKGHRARSS